MRMWSFAYPFGCLVSLFRAVHCAHCLAGGAHCLADGAHWLAAVNVAGVILTQPVELLKLYISLANYCVMLAFAHTCFGSTWAADNVALCTD